VDNAHIRCPYCRTIDWFREGWTVVEDDAGVIASQRALRSAGLEEPVWSCMTCGDETPRPSLLATRLDASATPVVRR
jgi:hypothetical protein